MTGWGGPQWVLATMFAIATLLNIGGFCIKPSPVAERLGWLASRLTSRAVIIVILIWGGFF